MVSGATRVATTMLVMACLTACSTLEVSDVFVARETGERSAEIPGDDVLVSLAFDDDVRFGSAGVLGMPVVPMYASGTRKELNLEVRLRLDRRHEYSFAAAPCLATPAGPLCPERISIAPEFDSGDVNLRDALGRQSGGRIPALSGRSVEYSPAKVGAGARVTSAEIERDCYYDGNPAWISGYVNTIYTYRCAGACPTEFIVNADGIVMAGDSFTSHGSFHFAKKRTNDYRGLTEVQ